MKRPRGEDDGRKVEGQSAKRKKLSTEALEHQLSNTFRPDFHFSPSSIAATDEALRSFKDSLDDAIRGGSVLDAPPSRLSEVLEIGTHGDQTPNFVEQLLRAWEYGQYNNIQRLCINVPATLALVLRLYNRLAVNEHETHMVCSALLSTANIKRLSRSLSDHQDFVVSPCLRLLLEVCRSNSGRYVGLLHQRRDVWLKPLAGHLGWLKDTEGQDAQEDTQRPSIRSHSIRLLLAVLQYSTPSQRTTLFSERDVLLSLFRHLPQTTAPVAEEFFRKVNGFYVHDERILPSEKAKVFNTVNLTKILSWYERGPRSDSEAYTAEAAHQLLTAACTTNLCGLLREQAEEFNSTSSRPPHLIPSKILVDFTLSLRFRDPLQQALLLRIFAQCPSLVRSWFDRRAGLQFSVKDLHLSVEFIDFLTSVIAVPLKRSSIDYLAPEELLECTMPSVLTQSTLGLALQSDRPLVAFLTTRLLNSILCKSNAILSLPSASRSEDEDFTRKKYELYELTGQRLPDLKTISALAAKPGRLGPLAFESLARLLHNYAEHDPSRYEEEIKLGTWIQLTRHGLDVLSVREKTPPEEWRLGVIHILRALLFAKDDWFSQSAVQGMLCPFVEVLRIAAGEDQLLREAALPILRVASRPCSAFPSVGRERALSTLVRSLHGVSEPGYILALINEAFTRFRNNNLKFHDELHRLRVKHCTRGDPQSVSLLHIALREQWHHMVRRTDMTQSQKDAVGEWCLRYAAGSVSTGEHQEMLVDVLRDYAPGDGDEGLVLIARIQEIIDGLGERSQAFLESVRPPELEMEGNRDSAAAQAELFQRLFIQEDDPPLTSDAVMTETQAMHHIPCNRLRHLASPQASERSAAVTALQAFAQQLQNREDSVSRWLLLNEVLTTFDPPASPPTNGATTKHRLTPRLPTYLSSFAAEAYLILENPLHQLYTRLNAFLSESPSWDLSKIPLLREIVNGSSDPTISIYRDLEWLTRVLVNGLATEEDLQVYGKLQVFRLMGSVATYPYASRKLRMGIRQLFEKAGAIEGGSEILRMQLGAVP